ncbi:hypothetical protein Tco_0532238 [Tanacetum coccineum]
MDKSVENAFSFTVGIFDILSYCFGYNRGPSSVCGGNACYHLFTVRINKSWLLQSIWNVLEKERPGLLLLAFFAAQLIATPIAVYANWGWGGVIWLYSIVIYVPLDIFKFIIRYASSGKAWDNTLGKRTAFTSKKDYGQGEREAQWATDQRKLYETAQDQVAVGMGLLAGSTVMLLLYEDHVSA